MGLADKFPVIWVYNLVGVRKRLIPVLYLVPPGKRHCYTNSVVWSVTLPLQYLTLVSGNSVRLYFWAPKHHNKPKNGTVKKTVDHILISWVDQDFPCFSICELEITIVSTT